MRSQLQIPEDTVTQLSKCLVLNRTLQEPQPVYSQPVYSGKSIYMSHLQQPVLALSDLYAVGKSVRLAISRSQCQLHRETQRRAAMIKCANLCHVGK